MKTTILSSPSNPLVKELRALAQKKNRQARGEFLVEGIQPVLQAAQSGAPVTLLVVAPDLLTSAAARAMLRAQERAGTRIVNVSRAVLESFAEREHPSGLAAVVKMTARTLDSLRVDADAVFVALWQVSNPGNLGSILRTADAVNARGVVVIGAATDPYAPAAVKASRGALFTAPLVRVEKVQDFLDWGTMQGVRMVAASDQAAQDLWHADLRPPCALVFGNEGEGLPDDVLHAANAVRIPMSGQVDSLNLAVAASVLLYEVKRRMSSEQ
ncbi:MAG: RNA methyltransferase [Chloroflexi bacterium]|nr:RNA methyltransferase [Chloroflexota bacterium]